MFSGCVFLKSIRINDKTSRERLYSVSKLTNLEHINVFRSNEYFDDDAVKNYSALSKLKKLTIEWCEEISDLG
jgi:hypothetical protein